MSADSRALVFRSETINAREHVLFNAMISWGKAQLDREAGAAEVKVDSKADAKADAKADVKAAEPAKVESKDAGKDGKVAGNETKEDPKEAKEKAAKLRALLKDVVPLIRFGTFTENQLAEIVKPTEVRSQFARSGPIIDHVVICGRFWTRRIWWPSSRGSV